MGEGGDGEKLDLPCRETGSADSLQSLVWGIPREFLMKMGCLQEREEGSSFPDPVCLVSDSPTYSHQRTRGVRSGLVRAQRQSGPRSWNGHGKDAWSPPRCSDHLRRELSYPVLPKPHPVSTGCGRSGIQQQGPWERLRYGGSQSPRAGQGAPARGSRGRPTSAVPPGEAPWAQAAAGRA